MLRAAYAHDSILQASVYADTEHLHRVESLLTQASLFENKVQLSRQTEDVSTTAHSQNRDPQDETQEAVASMERGAGDDRDQDETQEEVPGREEEIGDEDSDGMKESSTPPRNRKPTSPETPRKRSHRDGEEVDSAPIKWLRLDGIDSDHDENGRRSPRTPR
jgi:hypothetical protein